MPTMEKIFDVRDDKAAVQTVSERKALEGLQDAIEEVVLIKQGKLKGIAAKDLLNELQKVQ